MNISLTPELEQIIANKVKSGMYHSASEVVREAIRLLLLFEENDLKQLKLNSLRQQIKVGIDQANLGEVYSENEVMKRISLRQAKAAKKK